MGELEAKANAAPGKTSMRKSWAERLGPRRKSYAIGMGGRGYVVKDKLNKQMKQSREKYIVFKNGQKFSVT